MVKRPHDWGRKARHLDLDWVIPMRRNRPRLSLRTALLLLVPLAVAIGSVDAALRQSSYRRLAVEREEVARVVALEVGLFARRIEAAQARGEVVAPADVAQLAVRTRAMLGETGAAMRSRRRLEGPWASLPN